MLRPTPAALPLPTRLAGNPARAPLLLTRSTSPLARTSASTGCTMQAVPAPNTSSSRPCAAACARHRRVGEGVRGSSNRLGRSANAAVLVAHTYASSVAFDSTKASKVCKLVHRSCQLPTFPALCPGSRELRARVLGPRSRAGLVHTASAKKASSGCSSSRSPPPSKPPQHHHHKHPHQRAPASPPQCSAAALRPPAPRPRPSRARGRGSSRASRPAG